MAASRPVRSTTRRNSPPRTKRCRSARGCESNCPKTGRSIIVIINDRGPFSPGRVLDLSYAAAQALHMIGRGLVKVEAQVE